MSQEDQPSVSVLIPVYNCLPFLDAALWSVRRQTFTDFECILVNDGSKDDSLSTLRRHAAEDPRLIVLDKPNGGIISALNAGLVACRGEFTARMDGDDLCLPGRFEHQVAFLRQHPEIGFVGGWAEVINESGTRAEPCLCKNRHPEVTCWCSVIKLDPHHKEITMGSPKPVTPCSTTIMMRRSVMIQLKGYDPQYRIAEDPDLPLRAGEITQLANLQQIVLQYRRRSVSQTKNWANETPKWNAKALLAAQARGRTVSRFTLAKLSEQMSWKKADQRYFRAALSYAAEPVKTAPASPGTAPSPAYSGEC